MSISATEGVGGAGGLASMVTPATSSTKKDDKEMFMQLLVAQLKYQDPTNPADTSQFLAQSAQFTSLEKMQAVADQTQQLFAAQMAFGASSLVGKQVSYTLADGTKGAGSCSGVSFEAGGPVLDVAGTPVPLAQVTTVGDAAAVTQPSTGTDTTGSASGTAPATSAS